MLFLSDIMATDLLDSRIAGGATGLSATRILLDRIWRFV